jgi:hypothetical protein
MDMLYRRVHVIVHRILCVDRSEAPLPWPCSCGRGPFLDHNKHAEHEVTKGLVLFLCVHVALTLAVTFFLQDPAVKTFRRKLKRK